MRSCSGKNCNSRGCNAQGVCFECAKGFGRVSASDYNCVAVSAGWQCMARPEEEVAALHRSAIGSQQHGHVPVPNTVVMLPK